MTLLLILFGILIIPGLNYYESILSNILLLVSDSFGLKITFILYFGYFFKGFLILGLLYLIFMIIKKEPTDTSLIIVKPFHLRIAIYLLITTVLISAIFNILIKHNFDQAIETYININKDSFGQELRSWTLINLIISTISIFLLGLLITLVLLKDLKEKNTTANKVYNP